MINEVIKPKEGEIWQHAEGGIYIVHEIAQLHSPSSGTWSECVIYGADEPGVYVRRMDDFLNRFTFRERADDVGVKKA